MTGGPLPEIVGSAQKATDDVIIGEVLPADLIKVLFIAAPMRGHAVPLMRLAAWFARNPRYEAHVWLGGSWTSMAPEGAILHSDLGVENVESWAAAMDGMFGDLSACKDWYDSMAGMLEGFCRQDVVDAMGSILAGAAQLIRRVRPQLVVADGGLQLDGQLPGLCASHCGAAFVAVSCPGRPEAYERSAILLAFLAKHGKRLQRSLEASKPVLDAFKAEVSREVGPELAKKERTWPIILPGCRALVSQKPSSRQTFVGPFLEAPVPRDAQGRRQRRRESLTAAPSELVRWMTDEACPDPIVYVAFGTLARVSEGMAARFVEGLRGGSWRVLWSMPEAQRACLPPEARESTQRWRLEAFVPQTEVLGYEGVRCFVSHCGQNSTHEALSFGVPMVCVPFYCDQFEWAAAVCKYRRAGVQLNKLKASPANVRAAVSRVLGTEAFRAAAMACADDLLRDAKTLPASKGFEEDAGLSAGVNRAAAVCVEALSRGPLPEPAKPAQCCACAVQ